MSKLWLHFHPDRVLYLRDEEAEDAPLKVFPPEHPLSGSFPLPEGVRQLEYYDGRVYTYDRFGNQLDRDVDPAPYEAILKQVSNA